MRISLRGESVGAVYFHLLFCSVGDGFRLNRVPAITTYSSSDFLVIFANSSNFSGLKVGETERTLAPLADKITTGKTRLPLQFQGPCVSTPLFRYLRIEQLTFNQLPCN